MALVLVGPRCGRGGAQGGKDHRGQEEGGRVDQDGELAAGGEDQAAEAGAGYVGREAVGAAEAAVGQGEVAGWYDVGDEGAAGAGEDGAQGLSEERCRDQSGEGEVVRGDE